MIITGILIIILNSSFLIVVTYLLAAIFLIRAISDLIGTLSKSDNRINTTNIITQIVLSIVLSIFCLYIPKIPLSVFSIVFGSYILINGLARLINYIILKRNKEKGRFIELGIFIIYFLFGLSCIITPLIQIDIILLGISIYLIRLNCLTDLQPLTSPFMWMNAIGLALLPTVISLITITASIHLIGSTPTSILGALEPVTALVCGVLVFGEVLTFKNIIGILMVLSAVTVIVTVRPISRFIRYEHIQYKRRRRN